MSAVNVAFLVAASFGAAANANFLEAGMARADHTAVTAHDIEDMLISELEGQRNPVQLQGIKHDLAPMFHSLPKSRDGRLESVTVRYALHRYFSSKHGWHVSGLEPHSTNRVSAMEGLAPGNILKLFNQRLHGRGMGLHELAIFAATLKDVIHSEISDQLLLAFKGFDVPTQGEISEEEVRLTSQMWLMQYVLGVDLEVSDREQFANFAPEVAEIYPAWEDTAMWADDVRSSMLHASVSSRNPFVKQPATFADTEALIQELVHHFGSFQDLDCKDVKSKLTDLEDHGTGRVPLSRFYAGGLDGEWRFTESVHYLRSLGALDETNPSRPSVMIANYVHSKTNCLQASSFYSVCCVNECEALLGHVEAEIAESKATPARLAAIVAALPSDTVDAPRNLSTALLRRLDEVAAVHSGMVLLHSRLFSQWMHLAYPRECAFPHISGTIAQVAPTEYAETMGTDAVDLSEAEMKEHVDAHVDISAEEAERMDMMWSGHEELLAGQMHWNPAVDSRGGTTSYLLPCAAMMALVSFAVPMGSAVARLLGAKDKYMESDKHLV